MPSTRKKSAAPHQETLAAFNITYHAPARHASGTQRTFTTEQENFVRYHRDDLAQTWSATCHAYNQHWRLDRPGTAVTRFELMTACYYPAMASLSQRHPALKGDPRLSGRFVLGKLDAACKQDEDAEGRPEWGLKAVPPLEGLPRYKWINWSSWGKEWLDKWTEPAGKTVAVGEAVAAEEDDEDEGVSLEQPETPTALPAVIRGGVQETLDGNSNKAQPNKTCEKLSPKTSGGGIPKPPRKTGTVARKYFPPPPEIDLSSPLTDVDHLEAIYPALTKKRKADDMKGVGGEVKKGKKSPKKEKTVKVGRTNNKDDGGEKKERTMRMEAVVISRRPGTKNHKAP